MNKTSKSYRISVIGLGYVGCVSAACLARDGHKVIGVDISPLKVDAINNGESPISEPGLSGLIRENVASGQLSATGDIDQAISETDVSLICVGTPSSPNGSLSYEYVTRVCEEIGDTLRNKPAGHVIVIRSTMLPGSLGNIVIPALEQTSGLRENEHFYLAFNPEFLRESTAISDYDKPPKIVIGSRSDQATQALTDIYGHLDAPLIVTSPEVAEMVKYSDNTWHAVKIAFGNEIGEICRHIGVDSHAVMDIFLQDTHLNISPYYLWPGFAFGGSCLPKDLRALTYFGRHNDLQLPLLQSVIPSNEERIEGVFQRVLASGARRVGIYGLSFKRNTDDLRESPYVSLVEKMLGKGLEVRIYDENIQPERLTGANKQYIDTHIPHLVRLLVDDFSAFDDYAEMVITCHSSEAASEWVRNRSSGIRVLDLARLRGITGMENYEGISW